MDYTRGDFVIIWFFVWCLWYIEHSIWSQREVEIPIVLPVQLGKSLNILNLRFLVYFLKGNNFIVELLQLNKIIYV